MIQMKLKNEWIFASYMNCVHTIKRIMLEVFRSDIEQCNLVPSYMVELNDRGHETKFEIVDDVFVHLCEILREELQAYKQYSWRGVSVDGSFPKTSIDWVIVVAWCRNGNKDI